MQCIAEGLICDKVPGTCFLPINLDHGHYLSICEPPRFQIILLGFIQSTNDHPHPPAQWCFTCFFFLLVSPPSMPQKRLHLPSVLLLFLAVSLLRLRILTFMFCCREPFRNDHAKNDTDRHPPPIVEKMTSQSSTPASGTSVQGCPCQRSLAIPKVPSTPSFSFVSIVQPPRSAHDRIDVQG
ncbi:hypothetical protein ASPVEDRAFT_684535 [Aspergillus versicolor CBS 583.65]|uniref:Uncharacterized protein n=1 Tax=Aspergillus versicolor CBS 583.65 TaxID=1036611 RepID=A0A1L9PM37_ASPVE|nr:uncharacterized protein ASPVEDRAFT_684535 [Aspergillus versicolor CBS 583.65]OJJ02604.1 hypothetical protein ASPVEDRAFT_684535 [Aspergillus versicolor CBS 583.65]